MNGSSSHSLCPRKCNRTFGIAIIITVIGLNILAFYQMNNGYSNETPVGILQSPNGDVLPSKVFTSNNSFKSVKRVRHMEKEEINSRVVESFYEEESRTTKKVMFSLKIFKESCDSEINNKSVDTDVPRWQQMVQFCNSSEKTAFNAVIALQIRIYKLDRSKWTVAELKQWMHYVFWLGVEHIYLCDHYRFSIEKLDSKLKRYIDAGLVTYIEWNRIRNPMEAQVRCYQHIIETYKDVTLWHLAIDMDEYPFLPSDQKEGCLLRYLQRIDYPISEVSMHNYLMLGNGDRTKNMTIERITRMTPKPANELDKPIYRPTRVMSRLHHNYVKHGNRKEASDDEIRVLHYWGSRITDFGPDTPKVKRITIEYPLLKQSLVGIIRSSLLHFGELDAFNSTTGP